MTTEAKPHEAYLFSQATLRCITPLHVGVGQDVGVVDLPVAREVTTGYPFVPGSGIRGALRDRAEERQASAEGAKKGEAAAEEAGSGGPARNGTRSLVERMFGPWEGELAAGCVSVLDARLLFFPVRSSAGVFHWLTCPFVLERYRRDREYFLGAAPTEIPDLPDPLPGEASYAGSGPDRLFLEEFPFEKAQGWSWPSPPAGVEPERLVLVSDEVFAYFARNATVVQQRNRLSTAKTVLRGALFSIEAVPPEAVFYLFLGAHAERTEASTRWSASEVRKQLHDVACDSGSSSEGHLVLGGGESVGLGLTKLAWEESS